MIEIQDNIIPADLNSCDREPIHIIGSIQPHGALLAACAETWQVTYASLNIDNFIGLTASEVLGRDLVDVIGPKAIEQLLKQPLVPSEPDYLRPWIAGITNHKGSSNRFEVHAHKHAGQIIVELFKTDDRIDNLWEEDTLRQGIVSQLAQSDATDELAKVSAEIVRMATEFDRVMIYRFAEDMHGEVIAESTNRSDSFLGLHYPASDIPEPARRHFLSNIIRYIPDIEAAHAPIVGQDGTQADATAQNPLDLTYSKLRGVSPIHVEYLRNMGVGASLSISLTANNRLWGLVACHNYRPRHLTSSRVRFAELLGATISTLLQSLENTSKLRRSISAEKIASMIEADARAGVPLPQSLLSRSDALLALFRANALYLRNNTKIYKTADALPDVPDFSLMRAKAVDGLGVNAHLSEIVPLDEAQWQQAAGAAYLEMSEDGRDYISLTRPHFEQTIRWAGKPEKVYLDQADGTTRLSPRRSFAVWSEERRGHSEPFDDSDLEALRIIRRALFALNSLARERTAVRAQQAAERDKARLRHALLEAGRKSSLGELASVLAHELSQPLFAVSNFVSASRRELENLEVPLSENIQKMMAEAVSEAARAADLVRRLRDFITGADLEREAIVVEDAIKQGVELAMISSTMPELKISYAIDSSLPAVWADHVQISLVILNLVRNSITAMQFQDAPEMQIAALIDQSNVIVSVQDNGTGIPLHLRKSIFEPFHRSTTKGMGIGLSLCRSIIETHSGRIHLNPTPTGTKISFTLPLARDQQLVP